MRRLISPFSMGVITAFALLTVGLSVLGGHVYAALLDSNGPNQAQFGGANAWYDLSNSFDVTGATQMIIPVYYPHQTTGPVHINVTCSIGNGNIWVSGFQVCSTGGFDIPAGSFGSSPDPDTGYWEHDVTVNLTGGVSADNYRSFRFSVTGGAAASALIGYSATNSSKFAIANDSRCDPGGVTSGCGKYYNYTLPFGVPCGYTGSGTQRVTIYDGDNPPDGGSAPYGIQPVKFTVTVLQEAPSASSYTPIAASKVKISGSFGGNQTGYIDFPAQAGYKYEFILNHVYSNNTIQFHLPYDSINSIEQCTAGSFSAVGSASCAGLTGYAYDKFDNSAKVYYYIVVNPAAGDAEPSYANEAELNADLDVYTAGLAQAATPKTDTGASGHGFSVPVPTGTAHRYNGPWATNVYYLYAREQSTNLVKRVGGMTVGPCAPVNCGSVSGFTAVVGQTANFTVSMTSNNYGAAPPPDPDFAVTITGPSGSTPKTSPATWVNSTNTITSATISYPVMAPGNYSVKWVYNGKTCGGAPTEAGYSPFFSVKGGDASAGNGLYWGASCIGNDAADIKAANTSSGTYDGAGSELGAIATGSITNFVSAMGVSGGAPVLKGHGLSFANYLGGTYVGPGSADGGSYGAATTVPCVHDYWNDRPATMTGNLGAAISAGSLTSLAAGSYTTTPTGPVGNATFTIGDGGDITISNGKVVTIYVRGNVYIDSNIFYGYSTVAQIPQFRLIVQGGIFINPDVTELHGIYIAQAYNQGSTSGGYIATCSAASGTHFQDYTQCGKPLTFVGAVVAENNLYLDRTHGNIAAVPASPTVPVAIPVEPAEIFRYSPELWLNPATPPSFNYQAFTGLPPVL